MGCCAYALFPDLEAETLCVASGPHQGHHIVGYFQLDVGMRSLEGRCCCGQPIPLRGAVEHEAFDALKDQIEKEIVDTLDTEHAGKVGELQDELEWAEKKIEDLTTRNKELHDRFNSFKSRILALRSASDDLLNAYLKFEDGK